MAKKKSTKSNKKSRKARVKVVTKKSNVPKTMPKIPMAVRMGVHEVCAITNPFCPEAIGAKWPDAAALKSVPWSINGTSLTVTNDGSGRASILVLPNIAGQYLGSTLTGFPNVAYSSVTNFSPFGPTFNSGGRWRITSWGLKINCIGTKMNTQGLLRVRLFSPDDGLALNTVNVSSEFADEMIDIPLSRLIDTDLFVIPQPIGSISSRTFNNVNQPQTALTLSTWLNPGWQIVNIAVDGGQPSVASINVTAFYHFEFTPTDGDSYYQFATPSPKTDLIIQQSSTSVLDKVGAFVSGAVDKVDRLFQSGAAQAIGSAALGMYTGNPQLAMTAYAATKPSNRKMIRDVD